MKKKVFVGLFVLVVLALNAQSWTADNGNGTFTNPLFYDEFTDPDIIRVGSDFYAVSSSFHTMPGLPVLHSKDLVNWTFLCYAFDRLDLGPEFHLEGNKGAYGNGIWAPAIRYHKGVYYIFVNVNDHGLQVFKAQNPAGPWQHINMGGKIYDLGILFDDDDKIYAVHGYDEVHLIEIKPDLSGYVEGSDRVIIPKGNAMGEGHHMYKINGVYYIISANYAPTGRMQCARSKSIEGPWETTVISTNETMGTQRGRWTKNFGFWSPMPLPGDTIEMQTFGGNNFGAVPMHQGGIVDLPNGDWWGFSMMDLKSVGRTTFLSPVTWQDGWPYFGIEGNLGRTPRTWIKPDVGVETKPQAPYKRSDNFSASELQPVWQWNHLPVNKYWSINKKKGALRLNTLPADHFFAAQNALTQRGVGPESKATVFLDASALKVGDIAGLGLLSVPYYWIGVAKTKDGFILRFYDSMNNETIERALPSAKVCLSASGNFDKDVATLHYSLDGKVFNKIGGELPLAFQMKTFQGVRFALFAFNTLGEKGGYADFDDFELHEPLADRSKNIPNCKVIRLTNLANNHPVWANPHGMLHHTWPGSDEDKGLGCQFRVHNRGNGRVALEALNGTGFVTVVGGGLSADVRLMKEESEGSLFQWQDMLYNQCMLLSLKTNRYVGLHHETGEPYSANFGGARPDRNNGVVFCWEEIKVTDK